VLTRIDTSPTLWGIPSMKPQLDLRPFGIGSPYGMIVRLPLDVCFSLGNKMQR